MNTDTGNGRSPAERPATTPVPRTPASGSVHDAASRPVHTGSRTAVHGPVHDSVHRDAQGGVHAPVQSSVHAAVHDGGGAVGLREVKAAERMLSRGTWLIVFGAMLYSVLTVTPLMADKTPEEWDWTAPILPLVVDAAVVIVVRLDSVLARLGRTGGVWPVLLRWMTGLMTLSLNTADSLLNKDWVGAAVHAVAPLLLIVTAETGLAYRRAIGEALSAAQTAEQAERHAKAEHARHAEQERRQAERERALAAQEAAQREQERAERLAREERDHQALLARQEAEHRERLAAQEHQRAQLESDRARAAAEQAAQEAEAARQETLRQAETARQAEAETRRQELHLAAQRQAEREQAEREQAQQRAELERQAAGRADRERGDRERGDREHRPGRRQNRSGRDAQTAGPTANGGAAADKFPEPQALQIVAAAFENGLSVRAAAARCGWSVGWVNARYQEHRTRTTEPGSPAEAAVPAGDTGGG